MDCRKMDVCRNNHPDCFALQWNGICFALTDTEFKKGDCPFYKNRYEVEKENEERKKRKEV